MPSKIVSEEEWLAARKALLVKEKEHLRAGDAIAAQRRDLPLLKTKAYTFEGPNGPATLADLFAGRKQLIVYHFMLAPDDTEGCGGCSFLADHVPTHLEHLNKRNTTFVAVSRAPIAKIEAFKKRMGWTFPWYSSFGSDFNYDFHVTLDEAVAPPVYNYRDKAEMERLKRNWEMKGEQPGSSVFIMEDGEVLHSYSSYGRGMDPVLGTYQLLDLTPLGRQDGGHNVSFRLHDKYDAE